LSPAAAGVVAAARRPATEFVLLDRDELADFGTPEALALAFAAVSRFPITRGSPGMVRFFLISVNESTLLSRDLDPLDDATLLFALLARDDLADAAESSDNPRTRDPCALLAELRLRGVEAFCNSASLCPSFVGSTDACSFRALLLSRELFADESVLPAAELPPDNGIADP